jgi:hypothetical protein
MTQSEQYWVSTPFFTAEPGEEAETNPGRYGRAMARWLAEKLRERGQSVEEVFGEDWGWCIMLSTRPYRLWVGCGNRFGTENEWGAFVEAEPSLLQRARRSTDIRQAVQRVALMVEEILGQVPGTTRSWKEDAP